MLSNPKKHWKFNPADIKERRYWDDYMDAYERALSETSTDHAPWFIIPADHKWVAHSVIASILSTSIDELDLSYPSLTPELEQGLDEARRELEAETR